MRARHDIAREIADEVVAAQSRPFERPTASPIPPMLWVGDGRSFKASTRAYDLIHEYAECLAREVPELLAKVSQAEISNVLARSFAQLLDELKLDGLSAVSAENLLNEIELRTEELIHDKTGAWTFHFGCTFLEGDSVPPISIGPVSISSREAWLAEALTQGQISPITERRIRASWGGKRLRKRLANIDAHDEHGLIEATGVARAVCTVRTGRQSIKMAEPKALLAARLTLVTASLIWRQPSRALSDMRIEHDGTFHRQCYAISSQGPHFGWSHSSLGSPFGHHIAPEWAEAWEGFVSLTGPVGEALEIYLNPSLRSEREKILKALFMSLWWFHDACREPSDLMAISKFAASLDSLAGGKRAEGIKSFIQHRLGRQPAEPWFVDGLNPQILVKEIYEVIRNNIFHGSMQNLDRDHSKIRSRAEYIGRQCIVTALEWIIDNPSATKLSSLRGTA